MAGRDYPYYYKEQAIDNINKYMRERKCSFSEACKAFRYSPATIKRWAYFRNGKWINYKERSKN